MALTDGLVLHSGVENDTIQDFVLGQSFTVSGSTTIVTGDGGEQGAVINPVAGDTASLSGQTFNWIGGAYTVYLRFAPHSAIDGRHYIFNLGQVQVSGGSEVLRFGHTDFSDPIRAEIEGTTGGSIPNTSGFSSSTEYVLIAQYNASTDEWDVYANGDAVTPVISQTGIGPLADPADSQTVKIGEASSSPSEAQADSTFFRGAAWNRTLTQSERSTLFSDPNPFAAAGPSITSVTDSVGSTADQITEGQNATIQLSEDATVSSAELQNSAGTRTATLPIQSNTASSVTVQGARGALRYGDTDNKVVLTLDDASTIEATGITFAAPSLTTWANGTSADTTSDNSLTKGMGSVPSDYQIEFTDDGSGDPINPVINSNTTVQSVENAGTGTAQLYDNTDGTWGPEATYSLELDTTVTQVGNMGKIPLRHNLKGEMNRSLKG